MPFRSSANRSRTLLSKSHGALARLGLEPLEQRRLLHAGHDHDEVDPVVQMGMVGILPGDEAPEIGAEPLHALSEIPALNSLPGAAVSVYLDFDGHFEAVWGTHSQVSTPVYSRDADFTSFSDSELSAIQQIWAQVAEDFSPFKVNVTTVEPPSFANGVAVRVSIGGNGAWTDGTYGGIAYVNSFTNSIVNTVYVFPANLSNGNPKNVAEASSHETGHAFGLDHQSLWTGSVKTAEYYSGPGNGTAPIMGNSYSATRGLWWNGTSSDGPTMIQDDLAVIARAQNGFGYRTDDYGNTPATAAPLPIVGGVSTAKGVITTTSDVDYFSFDTGAGQVTLQVTLPAQNNLDTRLELRDAAGALIASAAPSNSFGATIVTNLSAGSYRVAVASQGNYGDVGQYTLTANVLAPAVEGTVYLDADRDGVRDEAEPGLAGATIFDDQNSNGVWDATPQYAFASNELPQLIPERGIVRPTIVVSGLSGTLLDVNVRVSLQHGNISDLALSLIDPDGVAVSLMALNPVGGQIMSDTQFDSEAATAISAATPPYTGTFRPFGSLATLIGKNPNGVWKLSVSDLTAGNSGVIEKFELEFTTNGAEPKTTTDALGQYFFSFTASGEHRFRQLDLPGYFQTAPAANGYDVLVTAGQPLVGLDFGNSPPAIVQRALFYNASGFDGGSTAINAADDQAIAFDKVAYLPDSGAATFASVSSYSRGINGLIIDVGGLAGEITASDFIFRVGNNNAPGSWQAAPAPSDVQVRPGAGLGGTDRIEIVWAGGAIVNRWLEVVVRGNDALGEFNANTGLAASDVFFWGSKVGDSGTASSPGTFDTTSTDSAQVLLSIGAGKPITDLRDYNRDGQVTSTDSAIVLGNIGSIARINISAGAFAPVALPAIAAGTDRKSDIALALSVDKRPVARDPLAAMNLRQTREDFLAADDKPALQLVIVDTVRSTLGRIREKAIAEAFANDDLLDDLLA